MRLVHIGLFSTLLFEVLERDRSCYSLQVERVSSFRVVIADVARDREDGKDKPNRLDEAAYKTLMEAWSRITKPIAMCHPCAILRDCGYRLKAQPPP